MKNALRYSMKESSFKRFIYAMGSIFDISGTYFRRTKIVIKENSSLHTDLKLIASDWKKVGGDLKHAYTLHLKEIKNPDTHARIKRKLESANCID